MNEEILRIPIRTTYLQKRDSPLSKTQIPSHVKELKIQIDSTSSNFESNINIIEH